MTSFSESPPATTVRRAGLGAAATLVRSLTLRDVLVFTSVPLTAAVLLLADAALRYSRSIQFDDWWSARASVSRAFSDRVRSIATLPERVGLRQHLDANDPDPSIIRLTVPGSNWDAMHGKALVGWGEWVEGTLEYGKTSTAVRLRKRGDNSIHWMTDKRTMTVRTPRDDFYKRFRSFALGVKDVVPAYLANRMAKEFGILAPTTEVVPVFVNNEYYGAFRFIETVDESLLRPFDRLPGNIFRGDVAERGDYFKGVPRNLFDNPYLWDRVATNDRWTSAGAGQLALLLADLRGGTFDDHRRMMSRFDRDDLARLFAYLLTVGDPYHMDGVHNHFLYEDPSTQRLHFIPWDIRLIDLTRPPAGVNQLFHHLLRDPLLVDQVLQEVKRGEERGVGRIADSLMRSVESRHATYLQYDRGRVGLVPDVGSGPESAALLHANLRELSRWSRSDTVAFAGNWSGPIGVVDLETRGFAGVDLVGFDGPAPRTVRVFADADLDGVLSAGDREVAVAADSGSHLTFRRPLPLLAGWNTAGRGISPGTMPYRLFVTGGRLAGPPVIRNRITGAAAALVAWEPDAPIRAPSGWHPWRYPLDKGRTFRVSGTVRIDTTWRLATNDTLVVEPGSVLRLAPDVSIVSRGLVRAVGTAARPIRVVRADDSRPWGAFVLQDRGASGSVLRHVEFVGGGGGLVDRIEYIGMVNVHQATGVVIDSAAFIDNVRSDDTFHALHADVSLTNSRFVRANSDAVDYDLSTGLIGANVFEGSGGDAIDLMTSTPRVVGNRIERAGDKGISIGEASSPFVFDNRIANGVAGIEIKDRSTPVILNTEVRGVGVGLRVRMKNWRYGGSGFGLIANSVIAEATQPVDVDSTGRLTAVAVAGIDSAEAPADRLAWLYREYGIAVDSLRAGLPGRWRSVTPRPPLAVLRFEDDFGAATDGWVAKARVTRLEKRRDVLIAEAEGGLGAIERQLGWDFGTRGGELVVELAGRGLRGGRLVVESDGGAVSTALEFGGRLDRFRFFHVVVPPGMVKTLRIEIDPQPGLSQIQRSTGLSVLRAGRLDVRSIRAYLAESSNDRP